MGARTRILAFADGDIGAVLRGRPRPDPAQSEALARQARPGCRVEPASGAVLAEAVSPPDGIIYVLSAPGIDVICDQRLLFADADCLPRHLAGLGRGRRAVLHIMEPGSDSLSFSVWQDGRLVRALEVDPSAGADEDAGERLAFEQPYWAGQHPVPPSPPGWPGRDDPYPLPFHPLELAEEALRHLLGFTIEAMPGPGDADPWNIPMLGYQITDPSGAEQRREQALMQAARLMPRRVYQVGPGGSLTEISE